MKRSAGKTNLAKAPKLEGFILVLANLPLCGLVAQSAAPLLALTRNASLAEDVSIRMDAGAKEDVVSSVGVLSTVPQQCKSVVSTHRSARPLRTDEPTKLRKKNEKDKFNESNPAEPPGKDAVRRGDRHGPQKT
jgi:hypothetical protein